MKKAVLIFLAFALFSPNLNAQRRKSEIKWFSIAAKAGYGNSVLLNVNVIEDGNISFNYLTPSLSYGGRFTFTYGDNIGFGVDFLKSSFGQQYTINNNGDIYDKEIKIKSVDIFPFFRYTGNKGGYFEIGPKFSNIKSLTETNSIQQNFKTDYADYYEAKFTSIVLGFGLSVYRNERLSVNFGPRFAYSFTNLTAQGYNVADDGYYVPTKTIITPTNPLSIQGILEINYFFAFWGDATCGKGRLMLFK